MFDKLENQERISDTAALGEPTTFLERTMAVRQQQLDVQNVFAGHKLTEEAYDNRIKAIKDAVGVELENPYRVRGLASREQTERGETGDAWSFFDKRLKELSEKHPDKADIIGVNKPVRWEATKRAAQSEGRMEDAQRNYGGPWGTGTIADFAGSMIGMAQDPINAATLFIGPAARVGQGAKAIAIMGAKQAAANAGVEAALQPLVQDWRAKAGLSYGVSQAALDVGMAGAFGFGMDAGIRTAYRGVQKGFGRSAITDPKTGGVIGYESKTAATERATAEKLVAEQKAQAQALIDAIEQNNIPEARARAEALGMNEDPAFRGALNEIELSQGVNSPIEGLDDGSAERGMLQAMRAFDDGAEPFPAHIDSKPQAKTPDLSDYAELPTGMDGNQHYRNFEIDGKPVAFRSVDLKTVEADPSTFQFKGGRDGMGVSGNLQSALAWDANIAGKLVIYERADGVLLIADGHDRLSLAKRVDERQVNGSAFVFREKDGWKPDEVRAFAAQKNIEEGTGSLIDVAQAIKDRPQILTERMPLETEFMRQARALARLSDEAFARVANGSVDPKHGTLVADLVNDPTKHGQVLDELATRDPKTDRDARIVVQNAIAEARPVEAFESMLGGSLTPSHHLEARGDVLTGVMDGLMNRDLDGLVLSDVIGRLAQRRGYVSDLLNQAAKSVAEGQPKQRAVDAFLRQIAAKMEEGGVKGLDDGPVMLGALGRSIEQVWGPKFDILMGQQYRIAEASGDLSTMYDILSGKLSKAASIDPEMRAAMQMKVRDLYQEMGPDGRKAAGIADRSDFEGPALLAALSGSDASVGKSMRADPKQMAQDIEAFASHLESVLKDAQKPIPPRRVDDPMKDGLDHIAELMERYQGEANLAAVKAAEQMAAPRTEGAAPALTDLYLKQMDAQRSGFADAVEQATSAIESAYPGMTSRIASALDAAPELKARISELMGTDPNAAKQLMQQAMPTPARPDMPQAVDTSKPLLYTQAANARMAEVRAEIDKTIQMLPPDVRLRVEDDLVFNWDGTDARLDGLWDGYDRIVYASLSAGDPVRAVRHEVIHALRQSKLMTDDEFKTLYDFADKLKLRDAYLIDQQYLAKYTAAYGHRGADYVEMLLREETIANMFSDYSLNGRRFGDVEGGSWIDQVIDKVVSFMKTVRDSLNVLGFREVRDIFEEIESGRMGQRQAAMSGDSILAAIASATAKNADGVSIERGADGAVASVIRGGKKFAVERDEGGQVKRLNQVDDTLRADIVQQVVERVDSRINRADIETAINGMMPLIRSGDQAALKSRVDKLARSLSPDKSDAPLTMVGEEMAGVQQIADLAELVTICKA